MTLRVAFQMDPMETVDIDADTTFALAEVAQARGMELYEYGPEHLAYNEDRIEAWARPCLLYTSPSPRDATLSRMPSSA